MFGLINNEHAKEFNTKRRSAEVAHKRFTDLAAPSADPGDSKEAKCALCQEISLRPSNPYVDGAVHCGSNLIRIRIQSTNSDTNIVGFARANPISFSHHF